MIGSRRSAALRAAVIGAAPGALIWLITRLRPFVRMASVAPEDEPAMLIDEMNAATPEGAPALLGVRPEQVPSGPVTGRHRPSHPGENGAGDRGRLNRPLAPGRPRMRDWA
jgi:hypothetical protein